MLKIAHIATDEKFIGTAVNIFEDAYPNKNTFYITSPKPWVYIKDNEIFKPLTKKKWFNFLFTHRYELKAYDLVIFHGLPTAWLLPMLLVENNYVWLGWGYDYYSRTFDNGLLQDSLVLSQTKAYTKNISGQRHTEGALKNFFSFKKQINRIIGSKIVYKIAMRNLKVFSPVLPQEYELVKSKYGLGKKTKYSPWNYGTLEENFTKNIDLENISSANSILLGNSATSTNNHFEALDLLSNIGSARKICLPLSYGDMEYAKSVKSYIENNPKLEGQCQILDSFLELEEYNAIINDCGFVIMNHVRQQALGNIVSMMYRGAKVFLREESILFKYFKEQGVYIYSIQELESDPKLIEDHLTNTQIEHNRNILRSTWSKDIILQRTKELVETALV